MQLLRKMLRRIRTATKRLWAVIRSELKNGLSLLVDYCKQLSRFLVGLSDNSKNHLRQLVVDLLCQVTGGPCLYIGRDMKTSHKGLGITGSDWDLTVKALVAALDKFKVPQKEKDETLALVSTLKADIVEKP